MTTPDQHGAEAGCGQRLRKAREAAGLSVADVAIRLKMPARVVESLEAEDWGRLGAPVFVRGQLRSYARLLGLATSPLHAVSGVGPIQPPRLQPRTFTSPMQRLAEQLARRAVYIVITAALAIPVWVATRTHFAVPVQASSSLDLPSVTVPGVDTDPAPVARVPQQQPTTVAASLTPVTQRPAATQFLTLEFAAQSWLRVVAVDGRIIEEALLAAGESRSYAPGEVGQVSLGNASAVEVRRRGSVQDLAAFKRANVARFTVSSDGSLQPVAH
jgi:cytoskeleton protein RodZ